MAFSPIGEPCTKPLIRSSPLLLASSQVMNIPSNHICPPPSPLGFVPGSQPRATDPLWAYGEGLEGLCVGGGEELIWCP